MKEYNLIAQPSSNVTGSISVPGDKSISHRSIMFGAIAEGETRVSNFLQGEDSLATLKAFQQLGVEISITDSQVIINGVGLHGLKPPSKDLWFGNSGTAMRLMAGLLCAQSFATRLTGDESLSSRPMKRVSNPLNTMGANISSDNGHAPLDINPVNSLQGINYSVPVVSAQVKSAILLAGLYAKSPTYITEPGISRNHTELMLKSFGVEVKTNENNILLTPPTKLIAQKIQVPSDISSAAFFMVAAAIASGSSLSIKNVGINKTRIGVIKILKLMGANLELINNRTIGKEEVADIVIKHSPLKAIDIPENLVPLAIDEFPVLFIAAACASGQTKLTGASELRVKESDRILAMVTGLKAIGIKAHALDDGAIIEGGNIIGGEVNSFHDHRIAMAFAIASLKSQKPIIINQCSNIQTSFPGFINLANSIGLKIEKYI